MLIERFATPNTLLDEPAMKTRTAAASVIRSNTVLAAIEGRDPRLLIERDDDDPAARWRSLLREAARIAIDTHRQDPDTPWAERNGSRSRHPLGMAHPLVGDRFDLPSVPQPGHWGAVRVQGVGFGASARFIASPGHAQDGILTTPGGQSGRPGSPHYDDLHASWAAGAPEPLLPGPTVTTWTLRALEETDRGSAPRNP